MRGRFAIGRPTLLRRVLLALLPAFALVWIAVAAVETVDQERRGRRDRAAVGEVLAGVVARSPDDAYAVAAVSTAQAMARGMRRRQGIDAALCFELRDAASGRMLFSDAGSCQAGDPADCPPQAARFFEHGAGAWRLRIAEACAPRRGGPSVAADTTRYLAIAFPFVLLPLWAAAWLSLRPLRRLSHRIAARDPDDLSPVAWPAGHAELRPLVEALNRLLARARAGVAREHAFVHDAAHELRTPMATIAAQAHVLAHSADEGERREARGHLQSAVARGSRLIQQLLVLARLDAAGQETRAVENLAALVRDELAWRLRVATGSEWSFDGPDELPAFVDGAAFRAVLGNLLDNAVHHGGAGVRVHVELRREGAGIVLRVLDDGPGIAPAERERVFDRFHRGQAAEGPGSGLGLAIVRQAARRLGGSVVLHEGLDGRGCGAVVALPAACSHDP